MFQLNGTSWSMAKFYEKIFFLTNKGYRIIRTFECQNNNLQTNAKELKVFSIQNLLLIILKLCLQN